MNILGALYFMLPAYTANALPPLLTKIKFLQSPMDFGGKINGKRIFGEHKTWRGFILGTLTGTIVFWIQQTYTAPDASIALFDYSHAPLMIGVLLSAGALIGDALKSLFKRQIGIKPGKPWPIVDQLDYVAGSLLLASFVFVPTWQEILAITLISLGLTVLVKHIGYYLGVNKVKW